ncbi:succinate dehydrogenase/fumarate reductase iron-sulfur subunit [Bifidobacterium avesanii]|uniref:succinate dehydrogenase n=1 Tax=Bifidobacterium avesanii TaxID=1798157 RepID=A0A7K3TH76_9BIFI|nr:2Fe-2S iron-sulfur cluster-binding protein [Bifidobacterium avesanii]KAB8292841.1 (2Fe-2S)-binding protein [Bifidobacterium avesanii]NEG78445.1 4Fe-4S dicluster domain-containing protein [Bifidobacterium avesanii]
MSNENDMVSVTLRVHRFTPRAERERRHGSNPFARKSSPFGDSGARRRPRGKQWTQDYTLTVRPEDTVLDCLLTVKRTLDPTLAFRYSCGHGMCGSDAVAINGTPTLLCTAPVHAWIRNDGFRRTGEEGEPGETAADGGVIELSPLPGFPVQRDLIADIDPMLDQIRKLKPYLEAKGELRTTADGKVNVFEYLQSPAELAKYETLTNCIACGVCEGSCPVFAGGDAFIGPAALIAASRFVNDSRDGRTMDRLDAIDTEDGVAACQSVRACGRQCPRGIDVGEEMWQIIAKVRER